MWTRTKHKHIVRKAERCWMKLVDFSFNICVLSIFVQLYFILLMMNLICHKGQPTETHKHTLQMWERNFEVMPSSHLCDHAKILWNGLIYYRVNEGSRSPSLSLSLSFYSSVCILAHMIICPRYRIISRDPYKIIDWK